MRLFIAVNFDEQTKRKIIDIQDRLKNYGKGSFARAENLHLTLVFLGAIEPERLSVLKHAMTNVSVPKMSLTFKNAGRFKKRDGDIWWIGLQKNEKLNRLQKKLADALISEGFKLEQRSFTPHITLARRFKAYRQADENRLIENEFSTTADAVCLMLSERVDGRLTYSEIYRVKY